MLSRKFGNIPKVGPERQLYETVQLSDDDLSKLSLAASGVIMHAHNHIHRTSTDPDTTRHVLESTRDMRNELKKIDAKAPLPSDDRRYGEYFRIKHLARTFDTVITAPILFSDQKNADYRTERRSQFNGIYGVTGTLLGEALSHYDKHKTRSDTDPASGTLRGIINELTTIALLNRSQSSERIALPSHMIEDYHDAIDAHYWSFDSAAGATGPLHVPLQIKTSYQRSLTSSIPDGGVMISADVFGNAQGSLATSRLIRNELRGTATDEERQLLSTHEHATLTHIHDQLARKAIINTTQRA